YWCVATRAIPTLLKEYTMARQGLLGRLAIIFALTLTGHRALAADEAKPDAASETQRRVKEFARLVDSGDAAEFKKYVAENCSPIFRTVPMERHLEFFHRLYDVTRGVEFHSIQEANPNDATLLYKSKLTGRWVALQARVEPN